MLTSRYATSSVSEQVPRGRSVTSTPDSGMTASPKESQTSSALGCSNAASGQKFDWLMNEVVGPPLKTFTTSRLDVSEAKVTVTAATDVCSYNWVNEKRPVTLAAINALGAPPIFATPELPASIPRASGRYYIDQDAAHEPQHPFKPMFDALEQTKPNYDFTDVDLVVDNMSLRYLLSFIDGNLNDSLRFDLHLVEKTLFVTRRAESTFIDIDPNRGQSNAYMFSFRKLLAKWSDSESDAETTGHYRAVRYNMGGLNCVVKFEAHAFFEGKTYVQDPSAPEKFSTAALQAEKAEKLRQLDSLRASSKAQAETLPVFCQIQSLPGKAQVENTTVWRSNTRTLSSPASVTSTPSPRHFEYRKDSLRGCSVLKSVSGTSSAAESHPAPASHSRNPFVDSGKGFQSITTITVGPGLAEVTVRPEGIKYREETIDTTYHYPLMYFSRVSTLIVGTHCEGTFSSIRAFDSTKMLQKWEEETQEDLRALVKLLADWRDVAKNSGGIAVAVCNHHFWPLKFDLFASENPTAALEDQALKKFWNKSEKNELMAEAEKPVGKAPIARAEELKKAELQKKAQAEKKTTADTAKNQADQMEKTTITSAPEPTPSHPSTSSSSSSSSSGPSLDEFIRRATVARPSMHAIGSTTPKHPAAAAMSQSKWALRSSSNTPSPRNSSPLSYQISPRSNGQKQQPVDLNLMAMKKATPPQPPPPPPPKKKMFSMTEYLLAEAKDEREKARAEKSAADAEAAAKAEVGEAKVDERDTNLIDT